MGDWQRFPVRRWQDRFLVIALAGLTGLGLMMHILAYRQFARNPESLCGTDFPIFYEAAKLTRSPALYSPAAVGQAVRSELGCVSRAAAFIRLPYFSLLVWPMTLFPLPVAFFLWRAGLVGAVAGFIVLQGSDWRWALLACSWSSAIAWDFANGEDVSFILLLVAAVYSLRKRGNDFGAGLCLALCAAKFHLLVLAPVLLVARGMRTMSKGLAAGLGTLATISFAVQGWDWPRRYLGAILNSKIDPVPAGMRNLRGLAEGRLPLEAGLGVIVLLAVWLICRSESFEVGLAAVLAGGVLVSHHLTPSDWALLVPVALTLARYEFWPIRAVAITLATPFIETLSGSRLVPAALLALVCGLAAVSVYRARQQDSCDHRAQTEGAKDENHPLEVQT